MMEAKIHYRLAYKLSFLPLLTGLYRGHNNLLAFIAGNCV